MSDTTFTDISKMKVVDLRKELKSRGLPYAGDKAQLVARLQAALGQDDLGDNDINLDSDEIDSDGVLDGEDDKNQTDISDDAGVDTLNEELAFSSQSDQSPEKQPANGQSKPPKMLKRKLVSDTSNEKANEKQGSKESGGKKIVLNRNISLTTNTTTKSEKTEDVVTSKDTPKSEISENTNKVKIAADLDAKTRLELRAKRFGLPVKESEVDRKEARKQRFGQNALRAESNTTSVNTTGSSESHLEKLRKRAERFGQSVSTVMLNIENKEKIEKRKAKFSMVK